MMEGGGSESGKEDYLKGFCLPHHRGKSKKLSGKTSTERAGGAYVNSVAIKFMR
jgi:hypothetical protein